MRAAAATRPGGRPDPEGTCRGSWVVGRLTADKPFIVFVSVFTLLPEGSSGLAQLTGFTDELECQSRSSSGFNRLPLQFLTRTSESDNDLHVSDSRDRRGLAGGRYPTPHRPESSPSPRRGMGGGRSLLPQ